MKMSKNKQNLQKDINLIPNIDTTSERLSSDNTPGKFFLNNLTEKNLPKNCQYQVNNINMEKKFQKYSDNLIPKTMRNTPKNYSSIKENHYSQNETEEMTRKKSNIKSKKNTNKKALNEQISGNYQNIIKKIDMISSEKAKRSNYKGKIPYVQKKNISKMVDYDNKDSYLYLEKLKRNYSMDKLKVEKPSIKNVKRKNKERNIRKNLTTNDFYNPAGNSKKINFYPTSKQLCNSSKYITINISNQINKLNRNISFSYFNNRNRSNNIINQINFKDFSEIINVRKKYNETCNNFYQDNYQKNSNKKLIRNLTENNKFKHINNQNKKLNNNFDIYKTSEYSSINSYWNKRSQDTIQKISEIKNELFQKEENEIKLIPKISQKSKELAKNSDKYNIEFNNIYDRLFYINNLNLNLNIDKENNNMKKINQHQPLINEKSKKMTRTVDDLYSWQNKKENKIKENKENIFKKTVYKKNNTNRESEAILKERRPNYIHKRVEDRLIEQGKNQKIKKEMEKEKSFHQLTEQKIFVNNNYNNIKSKYLEQKNNNENNKSNENIKYNFINIANMRNYDNFNKKLIYYGPNLNTNCYYYYSKLNKSSNEQKTPSNSKSSDKIQIKCFDDDFNSYNNINNSNNYLSNINYNNISNKNQINCIHNTRIPKDLNDISRPQTCKNYNSNQNQNKIDLDNNISYKNNLTENEINNNEEKRNKTSYYSLLYNDMINYNSKIMNDFKNYNDKMDKIQDLKINLNIKNNEIQKDSPIKTYLFPLNNNKEKEENNKIKIINNDNTNENTGKFNINDYNNNQKALNINDIQNKDNINITENITENMNLDSEIINIKGINNNKNIYYGNINNEIINQITSSVSSLNSSKVERRDKRKEDLMKIINFSDNLYNSKSN